VNYKKFLLGYYKYGLDKYDFEDAFNIVDNIAENYNSLIKWQKIYLINFKNYSS